MQRKIDTAVSDDEYEVDGGLNNEVLSPVPGGPFSALTPSMWPQDILAKLNHKNESEDEF